MFSAKTQQLVARSILTAWASLALVPMAASAQGTPQLQLQGHGTVQVWNSKTKTWDAFSSGTAREGMTLRAIEGGTLDGTVVGEGASTEKFHFDSCTAVRFLHLQFNAQGNVINAKAFGQISSTLSHDREAADSITFEFPTGMEILGKDVGPGTATGLATTVFQTPNAASCRLAVKDGATAKLQGLTFVKGTIVSVDPTNGTFVVKDATGRLSTVTCHFWTQEAMPTLDARILNETPSQIVSSLQVGSQVIVYGVPTAGAPQGSLPAPGSGAFDPNTPINYQASVVFPPGGQYIYGGSYVLSSPITPPWGDGGTAPSTNTLVLQAGQITPQILPGVQLNQVVCEIGDEVIAIPPLPPIGIASAGSIGSVPIFVLLGLGAAVLLNNSNNSNNLINASP